MLRLKHRDSGSAHRTCRKGAIQSLGVLVFISPAERTTLHLPQISPASENMLRVKSVERKKQPAFDCTCRSPLSLPGEGMWSPGTCFVPGIPCASSLPGVKLAVPPSAVQFSPCIPAHTSTRALCLLSPSTMSSGNGMFGIQPVCSKPLMFLDLLLQNSNII